MKIRFYYLCVAKLLIKMVDKKKTFPDRSAESYSFLSSPTEPWFHLDHPIFRHTLRTPSLFCIKDGCLVVLAPEAKDWVQKGFLEMVESLKLPFLLCVLPCLLLPLLSPDAEWGDLTGRSWNILRV